MKITGSYYKYSAQSRSTRPSMGLTQDKFVKNTVSFGSSFYDQLTPKETKEVAKYFNDANKNKALSIPASDAANIINILGGKVVANLLKTDLFERIKKLTEIDNTETYTKLAAQVKPESFAKLFGMDSLQENINSLGSPDHNFYRLKHRTQLKVWSRISPRETIDKMLELTTGPITKNNSGLMGIFTVKKNGLLCGLFSQTYISSEKTVIKDDVLFEDQLETLNVSLKCLPKQKQEAAAVNISKKLIDATAQAIEYGYINEIKNKNCENLPSRKVRIINFVKENLLPCVEDSSSRKLIEGKLIKLKAK